MTPPEHCACGSTHPEPAGGIDDLAAAAFGQNDVTVLSDECYIEFTWRRRSRSCSTAPTTCLRCTCSPSVQTRRWPAGFYAGDTDLVQYLREVRKHGGLMVPGPVQAAAVAAFDDQQHVDVSGRSIENVSSSALPIAAAGADVELPVVASTCGLRPLAVMPGRSPERSPSEPV